jgi:hypothetical protein
MPDKAGTGEDITLPQLKRTLPIRAWWTLSGAVVVLLVGTATLGGWVQSVRDERSSAADEAKIDQLNSKLDEANGKIQTMIGMLKDAAARDNAIESKSEFLDRFLAYKIAPNDASKTTFIGYVCALWKNSEQHRVRVDEAPLMLSPDNIRGGLSPELKRLLEAKGISPIFFDHAEHPTVTRVSPLPLPTPVVSPTPAEAISTIQKVARSEHLAKSVHFYDGTTYQVPDEIAFAVHSDPQCRPQ